MGALTLEDIHETYRKKIYTQSYENKGTIEGVKCVEIKNFVGEDGDFSEIFRISTDGSIAEFPGFHIAQINRSNLHGGAVKAWHVHLKQNEVWYVLPQCHLFVGLWDVRRESKTAHQTMRFSLGGGKSYLLYIPKGVAHGAKNFLSTTSTMLYFVDTQFDRNNPDELRLAWDSVGADFWTPTRD